MKEFKQQIIDRMTDRHADLKIVSLRDTAAEFGIYHISRQDTADIAKALKSIPGAKLVRLVSPSHDSLFQSLCLVDDDVEFEDVDFSGGEA